MSHSQNSNKMENDSEAHRQPKVAEQDNKQQLFELETVFDGRRDKVN